MQWTDRVRQIRMLLVIVAVVIAVVSLSVSHILVDDLSKEERNKMEVWAQALHALSNADENTDLTLVLSVIRGNNTIPVIVMDAGGNVTDYRNVKVNARNEEGSDGIIEILGLSGDIEPKQSTCKGGILAVNAGDTKPNVESVVLKGDGSGFISTEDTFATINDVYINKTAAEIRTFFDFILNKVN